MKRIAPSLLSPFLVGAVAFLFCCAPRVSAKDKDLIPSEDPIIPRMHAMGLVEGRNNIYRCASPTIDVAEKMSGRTPTAQDRADARARMRHLYDLGIRTVVSFEKEDAPGEGEESTDERVAVGLEKTAAAEVGIAYVSFPAGNKGKNSFEDMSDEAVLAWADGVMGAVLKASAQGGVAFHCKSGHDRTGLFAGYIRIKYQHWSADQAIAEMRRDGHSWTKFARAGAKTSWLEDHLSGIAKILADSAPAS